MIKICVYDYYKSCYRYFYTTLSSQRYWKKYCRLYTKNGVNLGYLFISWSSKKRNYNCWHYGSSELLSENQK